MRLWTWFSSSALTLLACSLAAGCGTRNFGADEHSLGETKLLRTTGNMRFVTQRPHPRGSLPILCTEPNPDVAVTLSTALGLAGSGSVPQGPTANVSGNYSAAQQAMELAGRTAPVLALRDGLYQACQAYANGILGQSAYALILSQYGDVLVQLIGQSSGSGKSGNPSGSNPSAAAPGAAVTVTNAISTSRAAERPSGSTEFGSKTTTPAPAPPAIQLQPIMQALLAACISEYDPTRVGIQDKNNPVLDWADCKQLVTRFISLVPDHTAPAPATPKPVTALRVRSQH